MERRVRSMKKCKIKLSKRIRQNFPFYIMITPGLCYLIINNYLPLPGLQLAFKKMNYAKGIWDSPWVGIKNFTFYLEALIPGLL